MFFNNASAYTDGLEVGPDSVGRNIAWHLNPDVNTTVGPTLLDGDAWLNPPLLQVAPPNIGNDFYFNAAWSLPDVEKRLRNTEMWAYYVDSTTADAPFYADQVTDLVLTFPTKHHHFFFTGWPYWMGPNTPQDIEMYYKNVSDFRALIKGRWDIILNAPCYMGVNIWDSEENLDSGSTPGPQPSPGPPPPGTPTVPHEVNIIRMGTPDTILRILTDPMINPFSHGQFQLFNWIFYADERLVPGAPPVSCQFPVLGLTIRQHSYPQGDFVVRSSMTQVQFRSSFFDVYTPLLVQWWTMLP
jgi:hypothetical protein